MKSSGPAFIFNLRITEQSEKEKNKQKNLDPTPICHMQLSCKSIKLSVICSESSLKSNLKTRILCLSTGLVKYLL